MLPLADVQQTNGEGCSLANDEKEEIRKKIARSREAVAKVMNKDTFIRASRFLP